MKFDFYFYDLNSIVVALFDKNIRKTNRKQD